MKVDGNKLNYATSGNGSSNQFATEMLKAATNTSMVHVPYRGMAPAVTGLLGGETQILIASGPSLLPQVRGGKVRAIAVTSLQPSPIAPDLPAMSSVVPGYDFELWWGLLAPAGTPPVIVNQLNAAINKLLATSEIKAAFLREGAVAMPMTSAQFGAVIAQDIPRWQRIAKQQNISAE
jgi:tripartite-type tricarboxylate transporter receptor subunit TctC